jgi:hypothetical protein
LDSLLEGLQENICTLKQIISLEIRLQRIISYYNQGHIIQKLRTQGIDQSNVGVQITRKLRDGASL